MAGEYGKKLTEEQRDTLARGFAEVLNCNSIENTSDTPDHILGEYLVNCLEAFHEINHRRQTWYGKRLGILHSDEEIVLQGPNTIVNNIKESN